MMPNIRELREAKAHLGIDLPDIFLRQVIGLDAGTSRAKVAAAFAEAETKPTAEQLRQVLQIINFDLAVQPEQETQKFDATEPATAAIKIVSDAPTAEKSKPTSAELNVPKPELETSTSPVAKISFVEDRELTLGDIKPAKEKTSIANAGPGTSDDFKSYYNIDLPQGQIDDIELSHDQSVIRLKWKKKHGGFSYVVVGSASDFPQDVRHGNYRWLTQEGELVVPESEARFFTVFAFKEKGAIGIQIAQGLLVDDILELEAEAYENEVRLRWVRRSLDGVVKVARSAPNQRLQKPLSFSNYLPVPADALAFTDTNVSPGDTYEYRVFVEWKGPGGQIFETPGARITETTPSKVPNVDNFTVVKSIGDTVEISYLPVIRGEVRVYQLKGLPSAELIAAKVSRAEFDVANLDAGEFKWLGTRIIGAPMQNGKKVVINAPMLPGQRDSRTYVAITVLGSKALITDVKVVQQVGDIEELKVIDRYDYVLLRVSPPAGASALDVWVLSENAEVGTSSPTRRVQIDDEYRRFGGVIFGDNIKGLDKARSLDVEPKKIVVRGVSSWDGADHLGEPSEVSYPGRVEVHYRAVRLGRLTHKGSMPWYAYVFPWLRKRFVKKAAEENQTKDIAKFEVKLVGNRKVRQNTTIAVDHFVGTRFPIDRDDKSVVKFKPLSLTFTDESRQWMMENKEGKFEPGLSREEAEKMVGNSREAKRQRALRRSREKSGRFKAESEKFTLYDANHFSRLLPISTPSISETIFSIDQTEYPISTTPAVDVDMKVVIMGPKRSGKTTYVQALINYLSNQFAVQMRARLIAEGNDEYTLKKMQEMESFITQGNLPQATQSASPFASGAGSSSLTDPRKPMKFIFENGESVPIKRLQITDVAGEDMDKLETMRLYGDAIAEADLVVFLVDPLQIRQVRVALAGKPLPQEGGADPFNVLLNLSELLAEKVEVTNPKQKFAVVISKFDGIEDLSATPDNHMTGTITPGLAVTRDPMTNSLATSEKLADIQDNARVHNEALAILERLRAGDFVTLVKNKLPFAQYFVVSALGHSSYNDRMDSAGISSFRISDPIRWAAATAITEVPKRGFFASAEAKLADSLKARELGSADYPTINPDPTPVPLFEEEQPETPSKPTRREKRNNPVAQPTPTTVVEEEVPAEELQPQVEPEQIEVLAPSDNEIQVSEESPDAEVPESEEPKQE
jgi:hypothetical protein